MKFFLLAVICGVCASTLANQFGDANYSRGQDKRRDRELRYRIENNVREIDRILSKSEALSLQYGHILEYVVQRLRLLEFTSETRDGYRFLSLGVQELRRDVVNTVEHQKLEKKIVFVQIIRLQVEQLLEQIDEQLSQNSDLQEQYEEQVSDLKSQENELSLLVVKKPAKALKKYIYLQRIVADLVGAINQQIGDEQVQTAAQVKQLGEQIDLQLKLADRLVNQSKLSDLNIEFHEQLNNVKTQKETAVQQADQEAVAALIQLRTIVTKLSSDIIYKTFVPSADQIEEEIQIGISNLRKHNDKLLQDMYSEIENSVVIDVQFGDYVDGLRTFINANSDLSEVPSRVAFISLLHVQDSLREISIAIDRQLSNRKQKKIEKIFRRQIQALRENVGQELQQLEDQVSQNNDLEQQYGEQVKTLRNLLETANQQTGRKAIQALIDILDSIEVISQNIAESQIIPGQYQAATDLKEQLRQLHLTVRQQLKSLETQVQRYPGLMREFGARVYPLRLEYHDILLNKSGELALQSLLSLQQGIQELKDIVIARLEGGLDY